jgi:secreted trypsin-like serine protease
VFPVSAADRRCRFHHFGCFFVLVGVAIGIAWGLAAAPGRAANAARPRARASIVGGASASISSFPFQAALYDPAAGSPAAGFFCGGVIVDATHVITAAHCLAGGGHGRGSVGGEVAALAGSTSLTQLTPGSVRDPAVGVSVDPQYDPADNDYDIGVVTLARPLWPGPGTPAVDGVSRIAPLAIEPAAAAYYGESNATPAGIATVSGWGDTMPAPVGPPAYPSELRSVGVPLVSETLCQEEYAAIEQPITPRMICAGGSSPRADSCYGDSGGPLVVDRDSPANPPGDYVLVGLVDFGNGCAQPGFAGVYTSIADPAIVSYLSANLERRASLATRRPRGRRARHRRASR